MRALLAPASLAAVAVWAILSLVASLRGALERGADPVRALEAEFLALAPALPPAGRVGFLQYAVDDGRADHVRAFFVAQYALAPRLIVKRIDQDTLIVAPGAARAGVDERLAGFVPVTASPSGYLLYRREVP